MQRALLMLQELYRAYGELAAERRGLACVPGCFACCSDRVQLITLEGAFLLEGLERAGRRDLLPRVLAAAGSRPAPAATMNRLAELVQRGQEPPPEPGPEAGQGACPLLEDGLCAVYEYRPLACRTMASLRRCRAGGEALEDPWWLTLNTAFFQLVEQAAAGGGFGWLPDVLARLAGESGGELLPCRNLCGLPAPPEHQQRLQHTLERMFARPLEGRPLGRWLQDLRDGAWAGTCELRGWW